MKVGEVMISGAYRCREMDSVDLCARMMREKKVDFVPVVDSDGHLTGLVTARDLALRVVAENLVPALTVVKDVMSAGPMITADADEDLRTLEARLVKSKRGRALVLDGEGVCVGVLGINDIAIAEEPARVGVLLKAVSGREAPRRS